ncbi:effector-associated constant component EACC1 [Pseudonocardia xinjiangensis]|uniref:effector-associated constant component EACC1 n=1 Tax=Pseudonocardia xinjiangensis TaxID=75289 RepID=UPI003D937B49
MRDAPQAAIRLADEADACALSAWLNRAGHFRGLVDVTPNPDGTGSVADTVVVAVGSDTLALLVSKIHDWMVLLGRGGTLTVTYTRPDAAPLEIEVAHSSDRTQLIDRVRRMVERDQRESA